MESATGMVSRLAVAFLLESWLVWMMVVALAMALLWGMWLQLAVQLGQWLFW
jgi:hypothetical protein